MKLLKDIKKKYDIKIKKLNKLLNLKNNNIIDFVQDDNNKLILKNPDTNEIIIKGKYNFYGIYQSYSKTWMWASNIMGTTQSNIDKINKIRTFNYLFETSDDPKAIFYNRLLSQDVIYIPNNKMLVWINELLLYLSDDMYSFNPENNNNIQFINLSEIDEKYN